MKLLEVTLDTPAENLALDHALLDQAEAAAAPCELLRLWEPTQPMVVVGRASRVTVEVNRGPCDQHGIPILRRSSGGAAIVAGPGCLMYSMVLSYERQPPLRMIQQAHQFVLGRIAHALGELVPGVQHLGTSDLALADQRKFSGNSMRCRRHHLLYHGTLLYAFPLELIPACLAMPPRQPEYRNSRSHADFVANLPLEREPLRRCLINAWQPDGETNDWPQQETRLLAAETYGRQEWNFRL